VSQQHPLLPPNITLRKQCIYGLEHCCFCAVGPRTAVLETGLVDSKSKKYVAALMVFVMLVICKSGAMNGSGRTAVCHQMMSRHQRMSSTT
jgi:hypothetical protein